MEKIRWLWTYLCFFRILPAYIFLKTNRFSEKSEMDLQAWIRLREDPSFNKRAPFWQFGFILIHEKETRNIFLNRLHRNPIMFLITRILYSPLDSLYINMPPEKIGGGLIIQHGFATIISAKEIGTNCKIFQQVTIGYKGKQEPPIIANNVTICAGAIVVGNVHIDSYAKIGAGAVVTKDVPRGAVMAGVPARELKRNI